MFETAIDFMLVEHHGPGAFEPPLGPFGFPRQLSARRKPYRTRDGWACILPYSDRNWLDFFAFIGRPEVASDPRFCDMPTRVENVDALYQLVEDSAPEHTTAQWIAFCDQASIPCMPVLALAELRDDPHVRAVGMITTGEHPTEGAYQQVASPIRFGQTPFQLRRHAPRLGEHTTEALREAGLTPAEIAALGATASDSG